ncbi:hypothetical protein [Pseudobdellovibrio sp. HCB154]|uniref:hypothetical protein n=1 Tax=Pseudobdellovibrio sp. HCB154 TaxID=3386277 RepID=UPI0039171E12
MRNLIALLSLVSISLTAFAKEKCVTTDILAEKERIAKVEGLSEGERSVLLQSAYSVKMVQILACSGLKQKISKTDSAFGVAFMEDDMKSRIHALETQRSNIESLLKDDELSAIERDIYSRSWALIPQEIEREKATTASIIKGIKKLTRDF